MPGVLTLTCHGSLTLTCAGSLTLTCEGSLTMTQLLDFDCTGSLSWTDFELGQFGEFDESGIKSNLKWL